MAVRAIPLSVCHQGPPSGYRTEFKKCSDAQQFIQLTVVDDINAKSGWSLKTEKDSFTMTCIHWYYSHIAASISISQSRFFSLPSLIQHMVYRGVPRAQKREDQRAAGSPAASTQLALCLRLAIDLKGRKLATRRNPRWLANPNSGLTQYECGRMKPLLCPRHHRQVKLAVKT